jgi:hypothetical protein
MVGAYQSWANAGARSCRRSGGACRTPTGVRGPRTCGATPLGAPQVPRKVCWHIPHCQAQRCGSRPSVVAAGPSAALHAVQSCGPRFGSRNRVVAVGPSRVHKQVRVAHCRAGQGHDGPGPAGGSVWLIAPAGQPPSSQQDGVVCQCLGDSASHKDGLMDAHAGTQGGWTRATTPAVPRHCSCQAAASRPPGLANHQHPACRANSWHHASSLVAALGTQRAGTRCNAGTQGESRAVTGMRHVTRRGTPLIAAWALGHRQAGPKESSPPPHCVKRGEASQQKSHGVEQFASSAC